VSHRGAPAGKISRRVCRSSTAERTTTGSNRRSTRSTLMRVAGTHASTPTFGASYLTQVTPYATCHPEHSEGSPRSLSGLPDRACRRGRSHRPEAVSLGENDIIVYGRQQWQLELPSQWAQTPHPNEGKKLLLLAGEIKHGSWNQHPADHAYGAYTCLHAHRRGNPHG
jgi:hypothetical protein